MGSKTFSRFFTITFIPLFIYAYIVNKPIIWAIVYLVLVGVSLLDYLFNKK